MDGRRTGMDKELAWWEGVPASVSRYLCAIIRWMFGPCEAALKAFLTVMAWLHLASSVIGTAFTHEITWNGGNVLKGTSCIGKEEIVLLIAVYLSFTYAKAN